MYSIKKHFEFCYAHRLYGYPGKCGNIHGHTAQVVVKCSVEELPKDGIAIDFREISKKVGGWIEEHLDHRLILAMDDPAVYGLKGAGEDVKELTTPPSAENLAKLIFDTVLSFGLPVKKVSFWESPTSVATYKAKK